MPAFRITGLDPAPFAPLFGLSDALLRERGVHREPVLAPDSAPDRITLTDAEPGRQVLLLNHEHQPGSTPYRARHAIYVLEGATRRFDEVGVVPPALRRRLLSIRAFDAAHWMRDADVVEGAQAEQLIERLLANPAVDYLQVHFARRGCFAAEVRRA